MKHHYKNRDIWGKGREGGNPKIHKPVMPEKVISYLNPHPSGIYVDATVGGGGHARVICDYLGKEGLLVGIDRDQDALQLAKNNLEEYEGRFILVQNEFGSLADVLEGLEIFRVDGILLDLGLSSYQLEESERGFSYQVDGPLDMRMDRNLPVKAADILNERSTQDLSRIFKEYGEERWASRIASFVASYRKSQAIKSTGQFVEIIKSAIPAANRQRGGHPAKRCFQALRIAVNLELRQLEKVLPQCVDYLREGGVMVVICYHSLEDRRVKQFFQSEAQKCVCPPGLPKCACGKVSTLQILTKKSEIPSRQEIMYNPRARSARLRAARRI